MSPVNIGVLLLWCLFILYRLIINVRFVEVNFFNFYKFDIGFQTLAFLNWGTLAIIFGVYVFLVVKILKKIYTDGKNVPNSSYTIILSLFLAGFIMLDFSPLSYFIVNASEAVRVLWQGFFSIPLLPDITKVTIFALFYKFLRMRYIKVFEEKFKKEKDCPLNILEQ